MPKVIDSYLLERKIGSGQCGDVYKGTNKQNQMDIAIKVIRRQKLKGKFIELLENQIKVLKTCDNINIIKLYDLKKTANNFYLILEYCNEGDLCAYLKQKKFLGQDEAVEYLVQILNGFKTLVKNRIMHRDFKLANILKNDGEIKIADFGFAKLLQNQDFTSTMLGSPLNMAPEVLGGNQYNNKADIWSIGVVFYELLFGKTPYIASNIVDLISNIKNKTIEFPKNINKISPVVQDLIKKMLTVNPKQRIEWQQLFNHPINNLLEQKLKNNLENTLKSSQETDESTSTKMAKFYISTNIVIDHPNQIKKKIYINNYTMDVVKSNAIQKKYDDQIIKKASNTRKNSTIIDLFQKQKDTISKNDGKIIESLTERENQIKIFKRNANKLLHSRNIYVFLASVAQETMNNLSIKISELVGYFLVKKLLNLIENLRNLIESAQGMGQMQKWEKFKKQNDYIDIHQYIVKQHQVFTIFSKNVYNKMMKDKQKIKNYNGQIFSAIQNKNANILDFFPKLLTQYAKQYMTLLRIDLKKQKSVDECKKKQWIHLDRILDCLSLQTIFKFQINNTLFNFRKYYQANNLLTSTQLIKKVSEKYRKLQ